MATIQIRNVPEPVVRKLKQRAASEGMSLQEYMLKHLTEEATQPSIDELLDEIESRRYRRDDLSADAIVDAISDEREERTGKLVSISSLSTKS